MVIFELSLRSEVLEFDQEDFTRLLPLSHNVHLLAQCLRQLSGEDWIGSFDSLHQSSRVGLGCQMDSNPLSSLSDPQWTKFYCYYLVILHCSGTHSRERFETEQLSGKLYSGSKVFWFEFLLHIFGCSDSFSFLIFRWGQTPCRSSAVGSPVISSFCGGGWSIGLLSSRTLAQLLDPYRAD